MPTPVLTPWYVYKSSHESVFYKILFAKKFDTGFIGLRPYMCQVGSLEYAYKKLPKDRQMLGLNFHSVA